MKKSGATGSKPPRPKKSFGSDSTSCARLEVAPAATLAVFEPAFSPGAVALRRVRFGYFKPEAHEVHVVGSFNGWKPGVTPMRRDSLGDWSTEIELPRGEHRYRFLVDGEWRDDPAAQQTARNPLGGFDAIMVVV